MGLDQKISMANQILNWFTLSWDIKNEKSKTKKKSFSQN